MFRVATYNAHDCIGRDGLYSPARIAQIVVAMDADIVALQEITLDHAGDVVASLESITGMRAIDGTLFERGVGRYGNVLLTRHPVARQDLHDLSFSDREPRGVLDAVLSIGERPCRVMATHLGLKRHERREQIGRVATLLAGNPAPAVLMGDFNVWLGSNAFEALIDVGFLQRPVRSYPTWCRPLLALDRVFVRSPLVARRYWRFDAAPAAIASDHFPVVVDLDIEGGA